MKRLPLFILFLSVVILTLVTCVKEEPEIYGSISGIVKDADTKKPLSEVTVQLQPGGVSRMTGDDGAFSFVELESGTYKVSFSRDSYESYEQNVTVKASVESKIEISMNPIIPELKVSANTLDFGEDIRTLSFDIINAGKGKLTWNIAHDLDWLRCEPMTGNVTKGSQSVSVSVDRSKMDNGNYKGSIVVTSNGGSQTIIVTCRNNDIHLKVEPSELNFGTLTNSIKLTLTNTGNGTLKYQAETANNWVTLSKTSGSITTVDYLNVIVSRAGLSPGSYTSSVIFNVDTNSISIPVIMSIAVNEEPTVTAEKPTKITYNSASMHGTIVSVGSTEVTRYGFCWIEGEGVPTVDDNTTNLGDCKEPTAFESTLNKLKAETTYSYRAYARNSVGLAYSEHVETFTTLPPPVLPTVVTGEASEITAHTAVLSGTLTSLGNVQHVSRHGFCWSEQEDPTIEGSLYKELESTDKIGSFSTSITDLEHNTTYYFRAYAVNEKGIAYGDSKKFITLSGDVVLVTTDPTDIVYNEATVGGDIKDTGGNELAEKGVCWNTAPNPTINDSHMTADGSPVSAPSRKGMNTNLRSAGARTALNTMPQTNRINLAQVIPGGTFSCRIKGLVELTDFYVRAYVRTADGTVYYGEEKQFKTPERVNPPSISVTYVSDITTTSAKFISYYENGAPPTKAGFYWAEHPNPTSNDNEIASSSLSDRYMATAINLKPNTKYYVVSYAINAGGIGYGAETSFTTLAGAVEIKTYEPTDIVYNGATIGGEITDTGGRIINQKGICWSTSSSPNPSRPNCYVVIADDEDTQASVPLRKAMNERAVGTRFVSDINGSTTTPSASGRTSNASKDAISGGKFTCKLTGLEPNTQYYALAYCYTTDGNYISGNIVQFTTPKQLSLPQLGDVNVRNIKATSAYCSVALVSNGNATITQAGFCWSESPEPTIQDNKEFCNPQSLNMEKSLTNLMPNTKYYVRAFAVNSVGTAYSASTSEFTTLSATAPVISDVLVENVGRSTASVSSQILSDGNVDVTEFGICWSTSPNPTINDVKVVVTGSEFKTKLMNLPVLTTIYVRAYAINSIGTSYSTNDAVFTTVEVDTDVWDGSVATKFDGGLGTEAMPILISTGAQLELLRQNVKAGTTYAGVYFKLVANINLNNLKWEGIGEYSSYFTGNFDGNNLTISGFNEMAVFQYNNGVVTNLKTSGSVNLNSNRSFAAVVAMNQESGVVMHCTNNCNVKTIHRAGGICLSNSGIIHDCVNNGRIEGGDDAAGGIVAESEIKGRNVEFYNCVNNGDIISNEYAGGIVGDAHISYNYGGTSSTSVDFNFVNMLNTGDIQGTAAAGGIIGRAECEGGYTNWSHAGHVVYSAYLRLKNCCNYSDVRGGAPGGLVGKVQIDKYGGGFEGVLKAENSFWLNDIVNNIGVEAFMGTCEEGSSSHIGLDAPSAWYGRTGMECILNNDPSQDLIPLLNNWVNSNGATEYKKWKYETIDGYAVPVFDE